MFDNLEDYKAWKELLESAKTYSTDDGYDMVDDDVTNLTELFKEYMD